MIDNRQFRPDQFVRSAADLPEIDPTHRKRVLKAAKEAQHRRLVRRRLQWALGGSAAAILVAAIFSSLTSPQPTRARVAPSDMSRQGPAVLSVPEPDGPENALKADSDERAARPELAR